MVEELEQMLCEGAGLVQPGGKKAMEWGEDS